MSEPTGGLPSGVDPTDPAATNDSSLGADRAEAIKAEKKKWRDRTSKQAKQSPPPAGDEPEPDDGAA